MSIQAHTTLEMDKVKNINSNELQQVQQHEQQQHQIHGPANSDLRIPRAVPETNDDDEQEDRPVSIDGRMDVGIDDGLLEPHASNNKPARRPSFAFPGYEGNGVVMIDGVPTQIPDVNAYQHKKTLAQGMMDLALLSANANQLRYVLETYRRHPYYYPSLIFITLSIIFQVAVGVGLIWNSKFNIKNEKEICRANKINNYTIIGIFVITVVNVFISAFGVADPAPAN